MASANNNSSIPSLSAPVPLHRKDGRKFYDGLPQLFVGRNWPPAAATTGKQRHGALTICRAFTYLINSNKDIFSSLTT
jgi:hypothetical protein